MKRLVAVLSLLAPLAILAAAYSDTYIETSEQTTAMQVLTSGGDLIYIFKGTSGAVTFRTKAAMNGKKLSHILLVGGGGGGGCGGGGGGGGGGVIAKVVDRVLSVGTNQTLRVGAGGAGATSASQNGAAGGATTLAIEGGSWTAFGGSGGASWSVKSPATSGSYGSAGGACGGSRAYGIYTPGQGNPGGLTWLGTSGSTGRYAGGGGGACLPGSDGRIGQAGRGGMGFSTKISNTQSVYGSGGGAGTSSDNTSQGAGDAGTNAGTGGSYGVAGSAATANYGGGGGGGGAPGNSGGAGGSGVVILRFTPIADRIVAENASLSVVYDGCDHAPALNYVTEGATLKWSASGVAGTFTLDEPPTYRYKGTYTAYCQVAKPGYPAAVVTATLTITDPKTAYQRHWFVKATGGSASNTGISWDSPITFAAACANITAGLPGDYHEIVLEAGTVDAPKTHDFSSVDVSGTDGSVGKITKDYIRIRSSADDLDPRRCVVKGSGSTSNPKRFLLANRFTQLQGLTCQSFATTGSGAAVMIGDTGWKMGGITNCIFVSNQTANAAPSGLAASACVCWPGGRVDNCVFRANTGTPVDAATASCAAIGGNDTLVSNCRFENHTQNSVVGADVVVTNSVFANNLTTCSTGAECRDCLFVGNTNAAGTAISTAPGGSVAADSSFFDCRFVANRGSAGLSDSSEKSCFTRCLFRSNAGAINGGRLVDCTVTGNVANVARVFENPVLMSGCLVIDNVNAGNGFVGTSFVVSNCIFRGNAARQSLFCGSQAAACVCNTLVVENEITYPGTDGNAGVVYPDTADAAHGWMRFVNCTIANNLLPENCSAFHNGASDACPAWVMNCNVTGNDPYDLATNANMPVSNTVYTAVKATSSAWSSRFSPNNRYVRPDHLHYAKPDALHPYGYEPRGISACFNASRSVGFSARDVDATAATVASRQLLSGEKLTPRSRLLNGAVDAGCYECLPDPGLVILSR